MSRSPTNGELKIMVDNLSEKIDERHGEIMLVLKEVRDDGKATKEQTIKTNGRVSKLEFWRLAIIWAVGAILGLMGAMFPILRSIVTHEIQRSVQTAWQATLSDYDKVIINNN